MTRICGCLMAAFAFIAFSGTARAGKGALPGLSAPARTAIGSISAELKEPATAQVKAGIDGYTDFDAFSSVNDPLYREGSKELLEQAVKEDAGKKEAPSRALRDAPISKAPAAPGHAARQLKKRRAVKPLRADPVKAKNTF